MTDFHVFRSEAELGDGYADISLEPLLTPFAEAALRLDLALRY